MEEIEKRRKGCERREALKDAEDQREIELLDDRDPDQLRRKKQLMKKAQAKARKRNQRERRRINLPSVPFSSAASSSSIDLDLYRPEALSDEENIFVLQPDNNLWLTPSAPSSSTPSAPSSSAPRYADTPRYLHSTSSSTGISSSSSSSRTSTISISGNSSNSNSNSNSNSDSSSVSSSNGSASTSSSSGAKERDKATKKFAELQPRRRQQLNNTLRRRCMEAAERTLPKDDHKERHDVLQVLPIASLFTYTLYSFDFDNYSPTNSSIPSKPFSHNLLKFIKYIKTMMVSQEIFAHDSIDSMERKKRKLVNNFFIATEKAHSSKQHGTFVQLASLAKKSGFTNSEISSNIGLKKINDNKFAQVNHHAKTSPGSQADYGAKG